MHRQGDLEAARGHYAVEPPEGEARARACVAVWRARAAGGRAGEALEALRVALGHDPCEARPGPDWVDATLSRRLVDRGRVTA